MIGSCHASRSIINCGELTDCLASEHGVILGGDPTARDAARRELDAAASHYSEWFQGESPAPGLVILDSRKSNKASRVHGRAWTLTYDVSRSSAGAKQASNDLNSAESGGNAPPFSVSQDTAPFRVTRPGVLAHEICHKHAHRAFSRAWRGNGVVPDMLDEVAAISCESTALKRERMELFERQFARGGLIAWPQFLATRHPLKEADAVKQMGRIGGAGRGAVTFDISSGSPYEAKIAIFYSQAAAFEAFARTRSCKGMQVIGALLMTYDPDRGLDDWFRANGSRFCLPRSIAEFENSFVQFMKHRA